MLLRLQSIADTTTLANYEATYKPISQAFATFGWIQSNDTGQVQWDAIVQAITGTQLTGNLATYTVANTAGLGLRIGQSFVVTGVVANAAVFNITAPIVSFTSTTVTVAKVNANIAFAAEGAAVGTVPQFAIPANGAYVYEIWQMNDALQATMPVFVKVGYTNNSTQIGMGMVLLIGVGSNGSGTLLGGGTVGSSAETSGGGGTNSGLVMKDSILSGDTNRFAMLMWRDGNSPQIMMIERTHDITGGDTAQGACACLCGFRGAGAQHIVGWGVMMGPAGIFWSETVLPTIQCTPATTMVNGVVSVYPIFNVYGGMQFPMRGLVSCKYGDYSETSVLSLTLYPGVNTPYFFSGVTSQGATQRYFGYGTNNGVLVRAD